MLVIVVPHSGAAALLPVRAQVQVRVQVRALVLALAD